MEFVRRHGEAESAAGFTETFGGRREIKRWPPPILPSGSLLGERPGP